MSPPTTEMRPRTSDWDRLWALVTTVLVFPALTVALVGYNTWRRRWPHVVFYLALLAIQLFLMARMQP